MAFGIFGGSTVKNTEIVGLNTEGLKRLPVNGTIVYAMGLSSDKVGSADPKDLIRAVTEVDRMDCMALPVASVDSVSPGTTRGRVTISDSRSVF